MPPVTAPRSSSSSVTRTASYTAAQNPVPVTQTTAAFQASIAAKMPAAAGGAAGVNLRTTGGNVAGSRNTSSAPLDTITSGWRSGMDSHSSGSHSFFSNLKRMARHEKASSTATETVSQQEFSAARNKMEEIFASTGMPADSINQELNNAYLVFKDMQKNGTEGDVAAFKERLGEDAVNRWASELENNEAFLERVKAEYNAADVDVEQIDNKLYIKPVDEEGHHHGGIVIDLDEAIHAIYILVKSVSQAGEAGSGFLAAFEADAHALRTDIWGEGLGEAALPSGVGDMVFSTTVSGVVMPILAALAIKEGFSSAKHAIKMRSVLKKSIQSAETSIDGLKKLQDSGDIAPDLLQQSQQKLLSMQSSLKSLQLASRINIMDGGMGAGSFMSGVSILISSLAPFLTKVGIAATHGVDGANISGTAATAASAVGAGTSFGVSPAAGIFATVLGYFFGKKTALLQSRMQHLMSVIDAERPGLVKALENDPKQADVVEALNIIRDKVEYREKQIGKSNKSTDQFTFGAVGYTAVSLANLIIKAAAVGGTGALATTPGGIVGLALMLVFSGLMIKGSKTFLNMHGKIMQYGQNQNVMTDLPELKREVLTSIDLALGHAEGEKLRADVFLGARKRDTADQQLVAALSESSGKNFETTAHIGDEGYKAPSQFQTMKDIVASGGRHFPAAVRSRATYVGEVLKGHGLDAASSAKKDTFADVSPDITKTKLAETLVDPDNRATVLSFMKENAQSLLDNMQTIGNAIDEKTRVIREESGLESLSSVSSSQSVRTDDSAEEALVGIVEQFTVNQMRERETISVAEANLESFIRKIENAENAAESGFENLSDDTVDDLMKELTYLRRGSSLDAEAEKIVEAKTEYETKHPGKTYKEPEVESGRDLLADDLLEDGPERYQKVRGIMMEVTGQAAQLRKLDAMEPEQLEAVMDNKNIDSIGHDSSKVPSVFKRNPLLLAAVVAGAMSIPLSILIPYEEQDEKEAAEAEAAALEGEQTAQADEATENTGSSADAENSTEDSGSQSQPANGQNQLTSLGQNPDTGMREAFDRLWNRIQQGEQANDDFYFPRAASGNTGESIWS